MKKLVILCGAVALAACGSEKSGTFTTDEGEKGTYTVDNDGDGGTVTIKTSEGEFSAQSGAGAANVDLPAGYHLYPGADVTSKSTMKTDKGSNLTVAMDTKDGADKIVDYYRKQAEAAGVEIQSEIKTGNMQMISGKDKAGMIFSLSVFPGDDGHSTATLSLVKDSGIRE